MYDKSRRDDGTQVVPPLSPSQASPSPQTSRRRFLFALGMTGAGAAAASAVAITTATAPSVAPGDTRASRGYQETDHVRRFYATART